MTCTIRPATDAELDAITALEAASFPSPWKREFFRNELRAPGRYNRVVMDEREHLVGYLFSMYVLDEMHINKIAVDHRLRRTGVATAIMEDCFRFARSHELRMISLEVRESNTGARRFYEALSFHTAYRRPNYYPDNETALVMSRELA